VKLQDGAGQRRGRLRWTQAAWPQHTVRYVRRRLGQSHESYVCKYPLFTLILLFVLPQLLEAIFDNDMQCDFGGLVPHLPLYSLLIFFNILMSFLILPLVLYSCINAYYCTYLKINCDLWLFRFIFQAELRSSWPKLADINVTFAHKSCRL